MQASSLERRLWTMSLRVEMMASRLWLVRSEVSIRIPSETASCGAANPRGPSGSRAGDIELRSGSRRVSSKPNAALALDDLRLSESMDTGFILAETDFEEATVASRKRSE